MAPRNHEFSPIISRGEFGYLEEQKTTSQNEIKFRSDESLKNNRAEILFQFLVLNASRCGEIELVIHKMCIKRNIRFILPLSYHN